MKRHLKLVGLVSVLIAAILILWPLHERFSDGGDSRTLDILVEDFVLNSWDLYGPQMLFDEPFHFLVSSPLKHAKLPQSFSLAEDIQFDPNAQTLKVRLRKGLRATDGTPLTAMSYVQNFVDGYRTLKPDGPYRYLVGLEGEEVISKSSEIPLGLTVQDETSFTIKWKTMLEPKNRVFKFARHRSSFFTPAVNWSEGKWKNPDDVVTVGPWRIKSKTADGYVLVPSGNPGYKSRFTEIRLRRLSREKISAWNGKYPTLAVLYHGLPLSDNLKPVAAFRPKEVFIGLNPKRKPFDELRFRKTAAHFMREARVKGNLSGHIMPIDSRWAKLEADVENNVGGDLKGQSLKWMIERDWQGFELETIKEFIASVDKRMGTKSDLVMGPRELGGRDLKDIDVFIFRRNWLFGLGNHVLYSSLCDPERQVFFVSDPKGCADKNRFVWADWIEDKANQERTLVPLMRVAPRVYATRDFHMEDEGEDYILLNLVSGVTIDYDGKTGPNPAFKN